MRGDLVRDHRHRLLAERDRAEPPRRAGSAGQRAGIDGDLLAGLDAIGKVRLDLGEVDRGREHDAALRGAADDLGHRQERLPRQRRGRIDIGAAAVGEQERARRGAAILGEPLRIGERQNRADRRHRSRLPAPTHPPLRDLRPAPRHAAGLLGAARAVAAQRVEPVAQVDIIAAEAALGEHRGDLGGDAAGAFAAGIDHHAREPRRQRQAVERLALGGDAAGAVDGAEVGEQRARLAERGAPAADRGTRAWPGSATPHWARSSTSEERSAARISGWP